MDLLQTAAIIGRDRMTKQAEVIPMNYIELSKIVNDNFIVGKSDLDKVLKTAKGGFAFIEKRMKTPDERYEFFVGVRPPRFWFLPSKPVWVYDNLENKYYKLDSYIKWKKFYNSITKAVIAEKSKRS